MIAIMSYFINLIRILKKCIILLELVGYRQILVIVVCTGKNHEKKNNFLFGYRKKLYKYIYVILNIYTCYIFLLLKTYFYNTHFYYLLSFKTKSLFVILKKLLKKFIFHTSLFLDSIVCFIFFFSL